MNSFVKKIVTVAATAALTLSSAAVLAAAPLQLGVPDDGTNLSRGIKLLEAAGFAVAMEGGAQSLLPLADAVAPAAALDGTAAAVREYLLE